MPTDLTLPSTRPLPATTLPPDALPLELAVEHLTIPQRTALSALISGSFVSTAAKEAGVHRATVHRWITSHPVFRAAYNAWQQESKENTMARLLSIIKNALDAVTWAINEGDGRLAYTLLKDLGLLTQIQDGLTDPNLLRRQMLLDRLQQQRSLDSQLPTRPAPGDTSQHPPHPTLSPYRIIIPHATPPTPRRAPRRTVNPAVAHRNQS